ncbi:helix-turn-helix transcriptional regulator [Synergistes jonesii]|uniref:helix-turn-helix transcriptional regulator n=1 Tax=Synergistes jonesii TaxID=2754 RepID=UPI00248E2D05|nr:helix-turn-helix transcriptional regulator [Synergistes jonesii]
MFDRERMRMMRLKKRMSQAQLAAAVGISQPFLNNFETGRYVPSLKHLETIARALSCSAADLISDELDEEGGGG